MAANSQRQNERTARSAANPGLMAINDDFARTLVLPDGRIVTGGYDGRVLLWNPGAPGSRATVLGFTDHRVLAVAVLQGGRVVTSSTDGRVRVGDLAERHAGGAAATSVSELVACG